MKYANVITLKELLKLVCIEDYVIVCDDQIVGDYMDTDYIVENINSIPSIKVDKSIQKYRLSLNLQSLLMSSTVIITVRKVKEEVLENVKNM